MITAEALSVEAIRPRLTAEGVGRQIYLFGEVESTNAVLRGLARQGAVEGSVVLADAQTSGRGRLGRSWFSPPGVNVYASALFRPHFRPAEAALFSFIASLSLADAVKDLGLGPAIKWPNDVLVGRKKVGGSLVESATRGTDIEFLILGVGVNVNVDVAALHRALGPAATAATSLCAALGHEVDRNALAAAYLNHLDTWARRYFTDGPAAVLGAWRERDILTGRRVQARGEGLSFEGRVIGVDLDGRLVMEDSLGQRHLVLNEEIRIVE